MEAYLLACSGVSDVHVFQFGWSGERAGGFANRMENDLAVFKPTVATLCYGMNDGGYQPYREEIGKEYEANMRKILEKFGTLGVKTIVVGSPGAVDTNFFRPGQSMGNQPSHVAYNDNLAHLRDIDRRLATEQKLLFANVHDTMFEAMQKAQATLGKEYDVCGRDGFHPGPNGQLLMAYAFLKGLNLDGAIGEIVIDMKGEAAATKGHEVVSKSAGAVELKSSRWPFCFQGDEKSSGGTRSIVPFTSFNAELNRFVLKVKNLDAASAKVQWGDAEKEFTREQLTQGVNLMDAFPATPFDASFQKLLDAIAVKQNYETFVIKSIITNFRSLARDEAEDADFREGLKSFRDCLANRERKLDDAVHAQLQAVKHTLKVTPVK